MYQRLLFGEIVVAFTRTNSQIKRAPVKGAPIVFAEGNERVISPMYHVDVLKGMEHPNAGFLFSAFNTTPGAQEIWEKYNDLSSAFVKGTPAYEYVLGKQVRYMTQDQAADVDRLSREYGRMLGFGR